MIKIDENFKFKKNDIIIVGCSGGPDSMALVDMLLKIKSKYNLTIVLANVNYNVRREAKEETEYVEEFAKKNDLIFESLSIEEYGDDNFENEARKIRYNFYDKLTSEYKANYVMTAHHGDDLIETILMKIVRGSNINGYAGFKKIVDMGNYKIVRPLIYYTKDELVEYDKENKVKFYVDKSNYDTTYTRNRYRKDILPFLKKEKSDVHTKFLKFSSTLLEATEFIDKERDKALRKCYKDGILNIEEFKDIDSYLQKEIIYYLLDKFYQDDLFLVSDVHINLILNLINSNKANNSVNLPNDVIVIKSYNNLEIRMVTDQIGSYEIELCDKVMLPNKHKIVRIDKTTDNSNNICRLDSSEISLPLTVRSRRLGDRMNIKGSTGSRKIKDIFIDKKIKMEDRNLWPIVVDASGTIVWLPGIKKSVFDKNKNDRYDIILKYQ